MPNTSFKFLSCAGYANMYLDGNCSIDSLLCTGDFTQTSNVGTRTINYFRADRNVHLEGNNTFGTMILNNPGDTVYLEGGKTHQINNSLTVNSTAAFPILIWNMFPGPQAILFKSSDTVCVDYVELSGINATGGAIFYSGLNSVDIGNNSGWNWTTCGDSVSIGIENISEENNISLFPNPFTSELKIQYTLSSSQNVSATVYSYEGSFVKQLEQKNVAAGQHLLTWSDANVKPGIYFIRTRIGNTEKNYKVVKTE
jgi:hypothetical protein